MALLVFVMRSSVRVRQQAGLVEDVLGRGRKIVDGRRVTVIGEPRLCLLIAQLRTLAEGEQRLMTSSPGPGPGDAHDLVQRQIRCSHARWRLGKRAVVARVPAQLCQRDEHLRRVRHPPPEPGVTYLTCGRHQLGKRGRKQEIVGPVDGHGRTLVIQFYFDTYPQCRFDTDNG